MAAELKVNLATPNVIRASTIKRQRSNRTVADNNYTIIYYIV